MVPSVEFACLAFAVESNSRSGHYFCESCIWIDSRYIFMRLPTKTLGIISHFFMRVVSEVDSRLVPQSRG